MKLRLPFSLLSAVLAVFTIAASGTHAVEVPAGYTPYNLAGPDMLSSYKTGTGKYAFLLGASVSFSSTSATWWTSSSPLKSGGSILFTIEEDGDPYSLTFKDAARQAFDVSSLRVEDIGRLTFSNIEDSYDTSGGAIHASEVALRGNRSVTFEQNRVSRSPSYGGAIYATTRVAVDENKGAVSFTGNYAYSSSSSSYGGAIYGGDSSSISLSGNTGGVTITGNYADAACSSYGGAIYGGSSSSISLSGNTGGVTITGNYADAKDSSYGGAIYGGRSSSISICGNTGGVTITGNYADADAYYSSSFYPYGGAIYTEGSIAIQNNDTVLFSGNYEKEGITYRLRSIYMNSGSSTGGSFQLSAAAGNTITFEDSIYVVTSTSGKTVDVVFNGDYTDAAGTTVSQAGDIIFDAASVEATLADIKGRSATASEITNSKTSYIEGQIKLQAGRLIVRNGAQLNGLGILTTPSSGAAVVLENAGMDHSGAAINLKKGTSMELSGQNTVVADTLTFSTGSTLKLALTGDHRESAVLDLDANLEHFSLGIALDGEEMLASGRYKLVELADATQYTDVDGYWNADDITVTATGDAAGLGFDDLVWEDGVLYVEQGKSFWTNAGGDGTWNATSTNWSRNGLDITYRDGMDVLFDGTAAGTVQLEDEISPLSVVVENSAGHDYTFTGSGKLTGASSLTKTGTGELSLATANEHTGGTVVDGGTLRVQHSTALGAADATVTTAAGTLLSVENNAAVVLASATGNSLAGRVQVQTGASLEVQGTGYHAESTQLDGELIFSGAGVNHTGEGAGTLSGSGQLKVQGSGSSAQFSSAADYTGHVALADGAAFTADKLVMKADTTLAAVAAGTSLGLEDIVQPGTAQVEMHTTRFDSYTGTLNTDVAANCYSAGTLALVDGLTLEGGSTYQADGSSLNLNGGSLTLSSGSGSEMFVNLMLSLDGIYTPEVTQIVLFTGVAEFCLGGQVLSTGDTTHVFAATDYLTGDYVFETTALVYDGNVGCVYMVEAMPEPTTTTLSLLALAGLCARRRRND